MTNEEAIKILKCCIIDKCEDCPLKAENAYACSESSFAPTFVEVPKDVLLQVLELLKAQEQEISHLKHHVNCDAAEKLPSGCVGYGRGFNDDEPCETCKACEKYNGYGEE